MKFLKSCAVPLLLATALVIVQLSLKPTLLSITTAYPHYPPTEERLNVGLHAPGFLLSVAGLLVALLRGRLSALVQISLQINAGLPAVKMDNSRIG